MIIKDMVSDIIQDILHDIIRGENIPPPPEKTYALWEDGDKVLWEDGSYSLWE